MLFDYPRRGFLFSTALLGAQDYLVIHSFTATGHCPSHRPLRRSLSVLQEKRRRVGGGGFRTWRWGAESGLRQEQLNATSITEVKHSRGTAHLRHLGSPVSPLAWTPAFTSKIDFTDRYRWEQTQRPTSRWAAAPSGVPTAAGAH